MVREVWRVRNSLPLRGRKGKFWKMSLGSGDRWVDGLEKANFRGEVWQPPISSSLRHEKQGGEDNV